MRQRDEQRLNGDDAAKIAASEALGECEAAQRADASEHEAKEHDEQPHLPPRIGDAGEPRGYREHAEAEPEQHRAGYTPRERGEQEPRREAHKPGDADRRGHSCRSEAAPFEFGHDVKLEPAVGHYSHEVGGRE